MSASNDKIVQKNLETGGGDVAGGNIDKSQHLYFHSQFGDDSYLQHLYEQLNTDIATGRKIENMCEILNDFIATDEDEVVGLETKLARGGMDAQLWYARSCKETYAKNITRYAMYETAQVIHAYLLSKVESGYVASITPILSKTPPERKFEIVRKIVLNELEAKLGKNPLRLHSREIDGMLFFLTGKCRIKWE